MVESRRPLEEAAVELAERITLARVKPLHESPAARVEIGERDARRSLRRQIAKLERELADAFVTAFPMGGLALPADASVEPRLLDLEELQCVRDDLADRAR